MKTHAHNGLPVMAKQRRYYPNNVEGVMNTDWRAFPNNVPFEAFYEDAIFRWRLPSSHDCLIRSTDLNTGKIEERTYKNRGSAFKFVESHIHTHEFVVVDHEAVHTLSPNPNSSTLYDKNYE